jgi:hypothetical protein
MNTLLNRIKNSSAACLLAIGLFVGAAPKAEAGVQLLNFQAGAIGVFPSGGSSQFFGQVAWTPYLGLGTIGIRGDFGLTFLKDGLGDRFMAINTEALLSLGLLPTFSIEAGGGLHNWVNNGGTAVAISANAVFSTVIGVDRIYVGFSRFFLGDGVNEFRAGLGFDL